jgi:heptose-I-phosphate ethanolaminephosphotransferase
VVIVLGWFIIPYIKPYLKEVIAFALFTSIFFCLYCLVKFSFRKFILMSASLVLSILAFIKLTFYHHYEVKLSASALFVIFETNAEEASDFLSNYIDGFAIIIFIILVIPLVWVFVALFKKNNTEIFENNCFIFNNSKWLKLLYIMLMTIAVFVIYKKFTEFNILFTSIDSYSEYLKTKAVLKNSLAKSESNYISIDSSLKNPQTYIVIIGESTSRWHMELYGYDRNTNPLLSEIKNELVVFNDVITPNVHTILALDKILTLSDYTNPNKQENASLVQIANQAGFSTYWISNQRPVGIHESISTLIGNAAKKKYFLTTDNYNSTIYDENVIPVLKNVLDEKDEKKIIFIN